ncbi:hypothetical protein AXF42_Ash007973 [Apostasia shenzhenica]|uniref:Uncharacterized protein n=1 Tax=Apostasia shenzhenica TaxID=1088818 RepID=A0A2I0B5V7_9ASPA|nr:hypothetical protein AXF42_Ash007973 [Apostasia shenzhenica]
MGPSDWLAPARFVLRATRGSHSRYGPSHSRSLRQLPGLLAGLNIWMLGPFVGPLAVAVHRLRAIFSFSLGLKPTHSLASASHLQWALSHPFLEAPFSAPPARPAPSALPASLVQSRRAIWAVFAWIFAGATRVRRPFLWTPLSREAWRRWCSSSVVAATDLRLYVAAITPALIFDVLSQCLTLVGTGSLNVGLGDEVRLAVNPGAETDVFHPAPIFCGDQRRIVGVDLLRRH